MIVAKGPEEAALREANRRTKDLFGKSFSKATDSRRRKIPDSFVDKSTSPSGSSLFLPLCRRCVLRGKESPGDGPVMSGYGLINPPVKNVTGSSLAARIPAAGQTWPAWITDFRSL